MNLRRAALLVPVVVVLLAGCVPSGTGGLPTNEPKPPLPTLTPNPTPTITPTPGPETEAVEFGCSDLLSAQAIYDYNPNVSLLPSFSPTDSSPAGEAIAQQGLACELVNQTSGSTIDFGVVKYTPDAYAAKLAAVGAASASAGSFDGYFDLLPGGGLAQFFSPPYYVTVQSADFTSEGDIAPLVEMALAGLG